MHVPSLIYVYYIYKCMHRSEFWKCSIVTKRLKIIFLIFRFIFFFQVKSVVIPHFTCTTLLITLYTIYVLIQAYLTYIQRKKSTKNVFIHATLSMCVVITNWTCILYFGILYCILNVFYCWSRLPVHKYYVKISYFNYL